MAAQMPINITPIDEPTVNGFTVRFDPSPLNVEPGDQIFWTNNDSQPHWPSLKNADGTIDNSFFMLYQIAAASSSATFSPGVTPPEGKTVTYTYVCCLRHRVSEDPCTWRPCSVEGTIVVWPPGSSPA